MFDWSLLGFIKMEIQVKKDCFELIPIQKADEKSLAKILRCQGLA